LKFHFPQTKAQGGCLAGIVFKRTTNLSNAFAIHTLCFCLKLHNISPVLGSDRAKSSKVKVIPSSAMTGTKGKYRHGSTHLSPRQSMGLGGLLQALRAVSPINHCTGNRVGLGAGLDRYKEYKISCPHRVRPRGELSYLAPLGSENISAPYFKQCFPPD